MPRPKRCRKICGYPDYWSFAPEGAEVKDTVEFMLDEYETVRLIDFQKMTQEECATAMGVSRATVTGIYERARFKLADALVNGKRLRMTGGSYRIDDIPASELLEAKRENVTRIAVTYEDEMIGQHFGRTEQFKVYDISGEKIVSARIIDTNGTGHGALAGFLRAAEVQTLICGGIGMGARCALQDVGIELLPGVSGNADEAVQAFISGTLESDPAATCGHGPECGSEGECN